MSKTVSLRIDDSLYENFKKHADAENRSLSNFIETATLRYIEDVEIADDIEMEEIKSSTDLIKRIKKGSQDARNRRGEFA